MMESESLEMGNALEGKEGQYRVVRSRPRAYKSATALKGLYTFNAFLLSISLVISVIPTVLLLLNFIDAASGSALQFITGLGLVFFYPLTFFTLVALLTNLVIIYLLSLGIRKDLPALTGAISLLTAVGHILILSFIAVCVLVALSDSQKIEALTILVDFIRYLTTVNPGVVVLAIFLQTLVTIYFMAFLLTGTSGFRETLVNLPLSTFFSNGILIESARKSDVESLMEIYYSRQRHATPGKNSYELWKQLLNRVDLENDVRVARFDGDAVGFLITSESFLKVKSVHLTSEAIEDAAEECLLHDFVRLYSRSKQYVNFVEVSSSDLKLQKALSQNGWKISENSSSPRKVGFCYGANEEEPLDSE